MNNNSDDLNIISEFLMRFYHQEPDYFKATIRALEILENRYQYKWELSNAFRKIFESSLPVGLLKELVLLSANRYVETDEDAREMLQRIYDDNVLYAAVNFDEFRD